MPLRVRLTLWYGTALALILITFSVVLYTITERSLRDQVDESLQETAAAAVRSLEERGFLPLIDEDELLNQFPELARIDKFFQIFSPSGTITLRSPNIRQHEVPLSRKALEVAFTGKTIFESAKYPNEPPLRLISVPIVYRGSLLYVVQVGTSLEAVDGTLHRFLIVLLVMTPIALGIALAGGWFLAGRALRPVDSITLAAQRISGGDLTQRLPPPRSSDEIGRLTDTFNNMIARLETSFEQIRQFSSDASHELRTPLTVMKGETELVLRRERPLNDYQVVLESNLEEIDRMSRIVDELLFLSRADLGEIKMEREPVRLEALVEDIYRQALLLGQERNIQVVLGELTPVTVCGDELRLRELILNIVDNAVKYSHPDGEVGIRLRVSDSSALLSVTDHGIGFSPDAQKTDLRPLLPDGRSARPHEKRDRPGTRHLRLDRRHPSRPHRGGERSREGLNLYDRASPCACPSLTSFNLHLILLSSSVAKLHLCRPSLRSTSVVPCFTPLHGGQYEPCFSLHGRRLGRIGTAEPGLAFRTDHITDLSCIRRVRFGTDAKRTADRRAAGGRLYDRCESRDPRRCQHHHSRNREDFGRVQISENGCRTQETGWRNSSAGRAIHSGSGSIAGQRCRANINAAGWDPASSSHRTGTSSRTIT